VIEKGMGWLPDHHDIRDYTPHNEEIEPLLGKLQVKEPARDDGALPESVNLKEWFSPIENQRRLGSCTANAGVGLLEYFERRAFGKYTDASRLFLYKATRNLLKVTGDTGAYLRTTMQALTLFGAPPEEYWPYTDKAPDFDREPPAFCYAYGQGYQAVKFYRLDPATVPKDVVLSRIKTNLSVGLLP